MEHMVNELTIKVYARDGRPTVVTLIDALKHTLASLRRIERRLAGRVGNDDWKVLKASLNGSLRMTVGNSSAADVTGTYLGGIRMLEARAEPPTLFDIEDLEAARALVRLLDDDIREIALSAPGRGEVIPTQHAAANIAALIDPYPRSRIERTAVVGVMDQITTTNPDKPVFRLRRRTSSLSVRCQVASTDIQTVKDCLSRRVRVYGQAEFNRVGDVIKIRVERIESLRDRSELPQIADLPALDLTGGIDASDYLEKLRGDEGD